MTAKIDLSELMADREAEQSLSASLGGREYPAFLDNKRRLERLPALEEAYIAAVEAIRVAAECGGACHAYLYDEEGVEGWRWTHPDGREWSEIGDHTDSPPLHPLLQGFLGEDQ